MCIQWEEGFRGSIRSSQDQKMFSLFVPCAFLNITENTNLSFRETPRALVPACCVCDLGRRRDVVMLREEKCVCAPSVLGASEQQNNNKWRNRCEALFTPWQGGQKQNKTPKNLHALQLIGNGDRVATLRRLAKGNSGLKAQVSRDPVKTTAPLRIRLPLIL